MQIEIERIKLDSTTDWIKKRYVRKEDHNKENIKENKLNDTEKMELKYE